jgi:Flp pilus assembly protein TadD
MASQENTQRQSPIMWLVLEPQVSRWLRRVTFGAIVWTLLAVMSAAGDDPQQTSPAKPAENGYVGNEACATCHGSVSESFSRTAHAHASGPASENLVTGEFSHQKSQVKYRVYSESGKVLMSFERPGDPMVQGRRELLYYIGQGRRGTTYLFSVDGYFFETPINLYTSRHVWDMAPAYGDAHEIPMNLPALTSCMDCHVSGIRPPIDGTENRYAMPLFLHAGVTCERCHGPGENHVNAGKGTMVNPPKLAPERRDQICMQCHLEGNAAIERPGKHLYQYRPGDDLSDYVRYFVLTDTGKPGLRAASQFEELAQSTCKKKSGDAMSCTSCHDPHRTISPDERVAFYRSKCLACHGVQFGEKHHSNQPDCTQCHMPAALSSNIAHTAVTNHSIPRRPSIGPGLETARQPSLPQLVTFAPSQKADHDVRDLALAWQSIVDSGMTTAQPEAERMLRRAASESPDDPAVLSALGYVEQTQGANDKARDLYRKALALDPNLIDAATNLGVLEAQSGHLPEGVRLWQGAFQRAPGRSNIGMNLAHAFCSAGQFKEARAYTLRVLEFNPDLGSAKKLLRQLDADPPKCLP